MIDALGNTLAVNDLVMFSNVGGEMILGYVHSITAGVVYSLKAEIVVIKYARVTAKWQRDAAGRYVYKPMVASKKLYEQTDQLRNPRFARSYQGRRVIKVSEAQLTPMASTVQIAWWDNTVTNEIREQYMNEARAKLMEAREKNAN